MSTDLVRYHPFDWESVTKGQVFTQQQIRGIMNVAWDASEDEVRLATLQFRNRLIEECSRIGKEIMARINAGDVHVLTDAEALRYGHKMVIGGFRTAGRYFVRQRVAVDVANLTAEEQAEHERNIHANSRKFQALAAAERARKFEEQTRKKFYQTKE